MIALTQTGQYPFSADGLAPVALATSPVATCGALAQRFPCSAPTFIADTGG
ncbi:hypothetical protein [Pseudomonas oryzae]|uniref:Uncharacterized protein n=1 Tax=Pseudomonas oryzae TaxID=1392877 RepID=A0A1H1PWI3_9PSED|nr:hypothetical protein [Pseudomonas oryzae]SDS15552.1 hypothetical protein SAMN05216221_1192 [Pseudomonas oryzae]